MGNLPMNFTTTTTGKQLRKQTFNQLLPFDVRACSKQILISLLFYKTTGPIRMPFFQNASNGLEKLYTEQPNKKGFN